VPDITGMQARLRDADSLPSLLGAGFDAFEVILLFGRAYEDQVPGLLAAFMTTADTAVDGGDFLMFAPSLPDARTDAAPASACVALHTATRWLWVAGATVETAQPPPAEGQVLLNAIPANVLPPRQSPADGESLPELCAGIAITAERLRHAALAFSAEARWSPASTSASWRRDALASAITGHASQIILRALAQRAPQLAIGQPAEQALQAAVTATARAWSRWRVVTRQWDSANTGITAGAGPTPVAAEIGDLVLRTGRPTATRPGHPPAPAAARPAAQLTSPRTAATSPPSSPRSTPPPTPSPGSRSRTARPSAPPPTNAGSIHQYSRSPQ
jgi:hypothetical protein